MTGASIDKNGPAPSDDATLASMENTTVSNDHIDKSEFTAELRDQDAGDRHDKADPADKGNHHDSAQDPGSTDPASKATASDAPASDLASVELPQESTDSTGTGGSISAEAAEELLNPTLARFMAACQHGDLPVVEELISSGQVKASDTFSQGITGLHWAAINNRIRVVKYLVENSHSQADPNQLGGLLSASPLHWACRNGLVYVVDYLLSHTDASPTLRDSQNYNALHLAVHSSNITLVVYILVKCVMIDKSIYIDEEDNIRCTALHWAAYQGDILSVKALLHYGADVSKADQTHMTPLHWAFIRGYKTVLAALVEAGSDIRHRNDKGKDSFGVAKDMNCEKTWLDVLKEANLDPRNNWAKKTRWISPKTGKLITFFTPYVTLPLLLRACTFSEGFVIPKLFLAVMLFPASIFLLTKLVIPSYAGKNNALFQTPYLAGVFSSTAFWAIATWATVILPRVWLECFLESVLLAVCIYAFAYTFLKAMFINPGFVPTPTDPKVVFEGIQALIQAGKFDIDNFCVNTYTRKPLRSKYSRVNNLLVAKFDHYCPWVYNDIGVRNHKLFLTFIFALFAAIILFMRSLIEYFDTFADSHGYSSDVEGQCTFLGEELCMGYTLKPFVFNLMVWCCIQEVWVAFLCLVQAFQILKGLTTWEFSTLDGRASDPAYNHSTVPGGFEGPDGQQIQPTNAGHQGHRHKDQFGVCVKLLGLDQLVKTLKMAVLSVFQKTTHDERYQSINDFDIPTDFGFKQNWLDFWFIGDISWRNLFFLPIEGENNLNGQVVDYYKLYEYPSKHAGSEAV